MSEFNNITTRTQQGNIGEARALYEYLKMGYDVTRTTFDSSKYDLIVERDGKLLKVQVKTSRCATAAGGWQVLLSTSGGNTKVNTIRRREATDYDLLFVLTDDGCCWSIPIEALGTCGSQITVGNTSRSRFDDYQIL
jgi:hypothetical protein